LLLTFVFFLATVGWFFVQNRERDLTRISVARVDKEEASYPSEVSDSAPGILDGEHININTAPIEDLIRLPGIGSVRAGQIVTFREVHGPFQTKEDIMQVSGIGEKTFQKLSEYITVEQ
jgi:competence protein ComEA